MPSKLGVVDELGALLSTFVSSSALRLLVSRIDVGPMLPGGSSQTAGFFSAFRVPICIMNCLSSTSNPLSPPPQGIDTTGGFEGRLHATRVGVGGTGGASDELRGGESGDRGDSISMSPASTSLV